MQLTKDEHEQLNKAYSELTNTKHAILDRTFEDRQQKAFNLRILQEQQNDDWYLSRKLKISATYESPKTGGLGEVIA